MPPRDEREMDRLADLVADGLTLPTAARRMSLSAARREFLWLRIVARLGKQAR